MGEAGKRGLERIAEALWELPVRKGSGMRVPVRIYATEKLLTSMDEAVFEQAMNVSRLPGIVGYSFCMPDGHRGYGFPIGGVAAFDTETGVISPGGIGFDINCGMRLIATSLTLAEIEGKLEALVDRLFERIPTGVGGQGILALDEGDFRELIEGGIDWCVRRGYATEEDRRRTEEEGRMRGADASKVSRHAIERGFKQVGTLGSGNHYLEIQVARRENIVDHAAAARLGIDRPDQILLMLHSGSRGFGHQVATDYLTRFLPIMATKFHLEVRDRQLACAPFQSIEGQDYFAAMQCAVNMAFVNRQVILHRIREVFEELFRRDPADLGIRLVYDVTHNTAKVETHEVEGARRRLLVHRKGATRAFAPGMGDLPEEYRDIGQPVIIGGSMETGSYLLLGRPEGAAAFFTTAHGSGRLLGRREAKRRFKGEAIRREMLARGIYVRASSKSGLAEEAGDAYKSIDEVVEAAELGGLSRPVVRLVPVGNIKG